MVALSHFLLISTCWLYYRQAYNAGIIQKQQPVRAALPVVLGKVEQRVEKRQESPGKGYRESTGEKTELFICTNSPVAQSQSLPQDNAVQQIIMKTEYNTQQASQFKLGICLSGR